MILCGDQPSRREVLWLCSALPSLPFARAMTRSTAPANLKLSLVFELPKADLRALSPDGLKLCVQDWAESGHPLRVVELGTWRTVWAGRFRSAAFLAKFFADSQTLFVEGPGWVGSNVSWQTVVNLETGQRTEHQHPFLPTEIVEHWPLTDGRLLVCVQHTPPGNDTLALVEFPSYREILKVPYAVVPREPIRMSNGLRLPYSFGEAISDDRVVFVYSFDHIVVCRRTSDLRVLWTRRVPPQLHCPQVAVSADGRCVAAAAVDDSFYQIQQQAYEIAVYDGSAGATIALFKLSGSEGIALSPDGKLIAVVALERGNKREVLPTVHVHEVPSGAKLASVVHGAVKRGRHQWLTSHIGVTFTSDGRYMVTSGGATRVWSLEIGRPI